MSAAKDHAHDLAVTMEMHGLTAEGHVKAAEEYARIANSSLATLTGAWMATPPAILMANMHAQLAIAKAALREG